MCHYSFIVQSIDAFCSRLVTPVKHTLANKCQCQFINSTLFVCHSLSQIKTSGSQHFAVQFETGTHFQ